MAVAVLGSNFLSWTAGVGIGFDPWYPDTDCLSLSPSGARLWLLPLPYQECRREDSNLHTLYGYQVLNLLCLLRCHIAVA